ncbi:MAG: hypothetical protein Q7R52_02710 [archaeon]|nr:hypothetical protein [archaeon]
MIVKIHLEKDKPTSKWTKTEVDDFAKLMHFLDDNNINYDLDPPSYKVKK